MSEAKMSSTTLPSPSSPSNNHSSSDNKRKKGVNSINDDDDDSKLVEGNGTSGGNNKRVKKTMTTSPTTASPKQQQQQQQQQQSSILNFFSKNKPKKSTATKTRAATTASKQTKNDEGKKETSDDGAKADAPADVPSAPTTMKKNNGKQQQNDGSGNTSGVPEPMIPTIVSTPRNVRWQSHYDNHVMTRTVLTTASGGKQDDDDNKASSPPRTKIAGLDLDQTLVLWNTPGGFWPSKLEQYELWSKNLIDKLRKLYDEEHYRLVVFSNQGGVQKAHNGKKATLVKGVVDWLASILDRPLYCVMSTKSLKKSPKESFHKPTPKMWKVMSQHLMKKGVKPDLANSFFVGDSAEAEDDQGGVDKGFADAVGISFYTPQEYFGPSDADRRGVAQGAQAAAAHPPPQRALEERAALHGGYLGKPILLVLCGVQGTGKSTFCRHLVEKKSKGSDHHTWVHLSQDTINNGKPGKREKVEQAALEALLEGNSVIVDRTHLDPEQRGHFSALGKKAGVPVHCVLLNPPKEVIFRRLRARTDHAAGVQGEAGVKLATQALSKLVLPTYAKEENMDLISCTSTDSGAARLCKLYAATKRSTCSSKPKLYLDNDHQMPAIALGTMGIGKRIAVDVIKNAASQGFAAIDTAPTYKNEDRIGDAVSAIMKKDDDKDHSKMFCIVKIPKSVTRPEQVKPALEASLQKLRIERADLVLLHWPSDVIAAGTLESVWKAMEDCCCEGGLAKSLGVCNFNAAALAQLLPSCTACRPVVNQVERHPLLPSWELMDFCARNDVLLQAHTPLGQGKDELLKHPTVVRVARETGLSAAQVCLQWNVQQRVAVVVKAASEEHMEQVFACKEPLSESQMRALNEITMATASDSNDTSASKSSKSHRFVAPPFMYGKAPYAWGARAPMFTKTKK